MPLARPIRFTQAARADLLAAQDWYGVRVPGLGGAFRTELETAVERIVSNPLHFPIVQPPDVRRALLHRFPYSLFFSSNPEALLVFACFHARRDPVRWQRRM